MPIPLFCPLTKAFEHRSQASLRAPTSDNPTPKTTHHGSIRKDPTSNRNQPVSQQAPRAFLFALPFLYVIFDFAENGTVLALLAHFPDRVHFLAGILPYLTVVKRAASLLALAIPLVIFSASLVRRGLVKR